MGPDAVSDVAGPGRLAGPWRKEPGWRVVGSRPLDASKVQAPGAVLAPDGRVRLFYTGVGPGKPFAACQGYLLSAVSDDGVTFQVEEGIRLAPRPEIPWLSLRAIAPSVVAIRGGWRMYFEARGPATRPTVIASAVSADQLAWELEPGIRVEAGEGVGAPRFRWLDDGAGLLSCWVRVRLAGTDGVERDTQAVMSTRTTDGLAFTPDPGLRLVPLTGEHDSAGITAAEVVPPEAPGEPWSMVFSAWQDRPAGWPEPLHPAHDPDAVANGRSEDFAAASIAADLSGYRSRLFLATSEDGVTYAGAWLLLEGDGYGGRDLDAVHAEDMALLTMPDGTLRMYYAGCDVTGRWGVLSAVAPSG
jgi:hypothetical protein